MGRPARHRFHATTESEVVAFLLGGEAVLVPSGERDEQDDALGITPDPKREPEWSYWILASSDRARAVAELRADERSIFDPSFDERDEDDLVGELNFFALPDLRRGDERSFPLHRVPGSRSVWETTNEPDASNPPRSLTPVEFNRYRRGLLVIAEPDHSWTQAATHESNATRMGAPMTAPHSYRITGRILRAQGHRPHVAFGQGRHVDDATLLIEWARVFGLLDVRLRRYGVPAANVIAALAAIAPPTLRLAPNFRSFIETPKETERKWEKRISDYYYRMDEKAPRPG